GAEIGVGQRVSGLELDGALVLRNCFIDTCGRQQRHAKIVDRFDVIRLNGDGAAIGVDGVVDALGLQEQSAKAVIVVGLIWRPDDGGLNLLDGDVEIHWSRSYLRRDTNTPVPRK